MTDKTLTKYDQFKLTMRSDGARERFEAILNERAEVFMSSLLSVVSGNDRLQQCDTASILTSAAKAAILNLPIEPSLGFAYIVPFKNDATFILGYKGYIQLAIRTSAYEVINATEIYEGERITENRLTGEIKLNGKRAGDEVIGFAAYFRLNNGFEKFRYMSVDEVHKHAKTYSKSYGNKRSAWTTNFNDMGMKTVIRQLLSKYGLLSINMQDADTPLISSDGGGRLTEPEDLTVPDFEDIIEGEAVDVEDKTEQQPGDKPETNDKRPYAPEYIKEKLIGFAAFYDDFDPTTKQRSLLHHGLELCFAGNKEAEDQLHTVLFYLTGLDSIKKVNGPTLKAILENWLNIDKDDGGEYHIDPVAAQEAQAIFTEALAGEGQKAML